MRSVRRASGYRAAYVNRYDLPYDETPYQFDIEARDFLDLADKLGCKIAGDGACTSC